MAWAIPFLLTLAAILGLRLLGVPRALGWLVAAALGCGLVGYAVQGGAGLPGHPVRAQSEAIDVDPTAAALRTAMLPTTPRGAAALAAADAALRAGDTDAAGAGLLRAIAAAPHDPGLWTGLGEVLAAHDGGQLSPASRLAFRRAWQLAPRAPGPPFFLGMALIQSGDLAAAKVAWLRALALAPRNAPYRLDIAERLALLDQVQAMSGRP